MEKRNWADECLVRTSRSGGKGGQNVNKVETKVELLWQPAASTLLTLAERTLVAARLADRLDSVGVLHVVAQEARTQIQNREIALRKLDELIVKSLHVPKVRKATRTPASAVRERLAGKTQRSTVKALRRAPNLDD